MNPTVSIVVPIYNIPLPYFRQCFNSLIAQTYENVEIILVDDNDYGDDTARIIDELSAEYEEVIALHQVNSGVSVARNLGIDRASGEWILFVDPDDWVEPTIVAKLLEFVTDDLDIVACGTWVNYEFKQIDNQFFPHGEMLYQGKEIEQMQLQLIAKGVTDYFPPEIGFGVPWGKLYRKAMIDENQLSFIPGLQRMQDNIFNLYALEYSRAIVYTPQRLYHYRKEAGSASNTYQPNIIDYYERVNEETERFIQTFDKNELFRQALAIKVSLCFHSYFNQYFFSDKFPKTNYQANQEIKQLVNSPYYKKAIQQVEARYLLPKEKVFICLLKTNNIFMLRCVFWAEHKLREWKNGRMNKEITK